MSFNAIMLTMLPVVSGVAPHISGGVFKTYRKRPKGNQTHGAVDINYNGGQAAAANRGLPAVQAPTSGVVTFAGGNYGTVKIKDAKGFSHEILHMVKIRVKPGDNVSAGTMIGRMAGKGPRGDFQYDRHVHYQLRKQDGTLVDPVAFWEGKEQEYTAPIPEEQTGPDKDTNTHAEDPDHYKEEPEAPFGNVEEYRPRQPGVSAASESSLALWTNRVPKHEPWPRTLMVDTPGLNAPTDEHEYNVNHNPQFDDSSKKGSKQIGRVEGEETIERGKFWRR